MTILPKSIQLTLEKVLRAQNVSPAKEIKARGVELSLNFLEVAASSFFFNVRKMKLLYVLENPGYDFFF